MVTASVTQPLTPFVVGLTGGIGCGKSTVAEYFAKKNVSIIDADVIAHSLTAPGGAAIDPIRAAFGDTVLSKNGSLNRTAMRIRVFDDVQEKERLEAILHPAIRLEIGRQMQAHRTNATYPGHYLLLVAPLLFESLSYRQTVARTLAIDCPQSMQIERVVARSMQGGSAIAMSAEEVKRIIATQIPRAVRLQLADDIIMNSKAASCLENAVDLLHQRYVALSAVSTQNLLK